MIPSILNIYKFSGSRKGGENLESPLQVFYSFSFTFYIFRVLSFLDFTLLLQGAYLYLTNDNTILMIEIY